MMLLLLYSAPVDMTFRFRRHQLALSCASFSCTLPFPRPPSIPGASKGTPGYAKYVTEIRGIFCDAYKNKEIRGGDK